MGNTVKKYFNFGLKKSAELLNNSADFLARPARFERAAFRLGDLTYPLCGVCNIRFLRKIRIFREFRVKTKLFSVTFADFTASSERVAPRSVPKMAPFFKIERNRYFKDASPASFSVFMIDT